MAELNEVVREREVAQTRKLSPTTAHWVLILVGADLVLLFLIVLMFRGAVI